MKTKREPKPGTLAELRALNANDLRLIVCRDYAQAGLAQGRGRVAPDDGDADEDLRSVPLGHGAWAPQDHGRYGSAILAWRGPSLW